MPEINNVSLSSTELDELKLLVEAKQNGTTLAQFVMNRLDPRGDNEFPDRKLVQTYTSLASKGMISGRTPDNAFIFISLNQCGIDWINDYEKHEADEKAAEKSKRRHDYFVAAFGGVAGAVAEHFTGIVGLAANTIGNLLQHPL